MFTRQVKVTCLAMLFIGVLRGQELMLVYSNNFNGMLKSCGCAGNELGGMAFASLYLDELRGQYRDLMVVDAGDFFPWKQMPVETEFAIRFLEQMKYDALGVGDNELSLGVDFLCAQAVERHLPLVSGSLRRDGHFVVSPYVIKPFPWGLVGVTGYLDPNIFSLVDSTKVPGCDCASLEEVVSVLDSLDRMVDITVLLAHAPIEKCRVLAHTFRAADVIVAAHDQKVQTIPLTSDGVRIVEAGG